MVNRRNTVLVTKRSLRNSDSMAGKRPRRVVQSKLLDDTVGMSRKEEQELNKALYASLQETRRPKSLPGFPSQTSTSSNTSSRTSHGTSTTSTISTKSSSKGHRSSSGVWSSTTSLKVASASKLQRAAQMRRHSLRSVSVPSTRPQRHSEPTSSKRVKSSRSTRNVTPASVLAASLAVDESSQDSVRSSTDSVNGSKRKIHAQRKFAQGCSLPGMVSCTPVKSATPAVKMLSSKIPKTEDFLTFLCLRGSSILPPHLDFFNYSREEMPVCEVGSRPTSSTSKVKHRRDSSSDSSSTSSRANDEVAEAANVSTPAVVSRSGSNLQAKRSAARASAGTPETARGIVSLRQGLQRKVSTSSSSSSSARFPNSSPSCSYPGSGLTNTPPSRYRKKFYFTPEKPLSPSKASGIRPGEFTPPSLFSSTSYYMDSTHKFSPLVCHPSKFVSLAASPSGSSTSQSSSSSSSSSLSSSSACGASKRKRRISVPSSDTSRKRSPLGAFTPVPASTHSGGRASSRSGSPGKNKSSKITGRGERDSKGLKSARKNLFGKPASAAQQSARRIVGRSTGRTISSWKKGQVKAKNSRSVGHKRSEKTVERRKKRKGSTSDDNTDKKRKVTGEKKAPKQTMHSKRRMSTRLRGITRSTRASRKRLGSDNVDEVDGGRPSEKKECRDADHRNSQAKLTEKEEPAKTSAEVKPRKPYKIRPLERVRTRGYSLLLASKLALKRAKRDTASAGRQKAKVSEHPDGEDEKACGAGDANTVSRTRKPSERKISQSDQREDFVGTEDGKIKSGISSAERSKMDSSSSTDSAMKTRRSKDAKDSASPSLKETRPKKAKGQNSNSSSPSQSRTSSEEISIPTFHPSESDFSDPIAYINKIQPMAESYGMCRIIPPASWKLDSNKISEDIRFTSQVQQVHRLYKRWGPNVQHSAAINQHLLSEMVNVTTNPQIGGVEIDLPQLYQLVEEAGGPKKMADRKQWARVADIMNIPKQAMDRTMRLYDIYCRHVFPYASLSQEERKQLEAEVKAIHELQTVEDDAITKGKSMPVSWFNRIARNVMSMWFKDPPTPSQVESEYWPLVEERTHHVAVQCGHINTRAQASAFPTRRDSVYSRHAWNLNHVPDNNQSVLKYLGPVAGITIPTLHIGMLFSTSCWSADPHNLPYIQYLHTGADVIWYCIPRSQRSKFRAAMTELVPSLVSNKPRWLKEDYVMVNPSLLRDKGVKVGRCIQKPRQFVVVFPGAFTATISCGYSVAESVHYATTKWLSMGMEAATALSKSGEKELFSMSTLLCGLAQDDKVDATTLTEALPMFSSVVYKELDLRTQLHAAGLFGEKRDVFPEAPSPGPSYSKHHTGVQEDEKVCQICDRICFLSMVLNEQDEEVLCLEHGLRHVHKKKNLKSTRLFLRYSQVELETMLKYAKERLTFLTSRPDHMTSSQGSKTRTNSK